jgi:hypothetical protein
MPTELAANSPRGGDLDIVETGRGLTVPTAMSPVAILESVPLVQTAPIQPFKLVPTISKCTSYQLPSANVKSTALPMAVAPVLLLLTRSRSASLLSVPTATWPHSNPTSAGPAADAAGDAPRPLPAGASDTPGSVRACDPSRSGQPG